VIQFLTEIELLLHYIIIPTTGNEKVNCDQFHIRFSVDTYVSSRGHKLSQSCPNYTLKCSGYYTYHML
jgi:hypothetical protein